jgi:SpoVK/Ycf46/Vps4 family AAA+-type ATPase
MTDDYVGWVRYDTHCFPYQFYLNHGTKVGSWARPCRSSIPKLPLDYLQLVSLPEGWEMRDSYKNGVYFLHSASGRVQKQDPRSPSRSTLGLLNDDMRSLSLTDARKSRSRDLYSSSYPMWSGDQDLRRTKSTGTSKEEKGQADYDKALKSSLKQSMITKNLKVQFDDISGLEEAKESLQAAVILPLMFPEAFNTASTSSRRGVLLYGPPGTGKSLLAKALAVESDCTFFSISSSDIESKWVGESQRYASKMKADYMLIKSDEEKLNCFLN